MSAIFLRAREPVNSLTHFYGACFAAAATAAMVAAALLSPGASPVALLSALVFGLSMTALYTASSVYHYVTGSLRRIARLRRLDHSMIYVLIAGSYTPILLTFLPGRRGVWFTVGIWCVALLGILVKLCWFQAPRWLSTCFYLAMGWSILGDVGIFSAMPLPCTLLIAAGGLAYTAGGVIYLLKKPNGRAVFGFHEIFHLFILAGSALHFSAVFFFVIL